MSGMTTALLTAKERVNWRPIIYLCWPSAGVVILREPSIKEAEFIYEIDKRLPGAINREEIIQSFLLYENIGLFDRPEAGFVAATFEALTGHCEPDIPRLNRRIEEGRSRATFLSDFMDSHIRMVAPNLDEEKLRDMTYSELLRLTLSAERVLMDVSEGKIDPFKLYDMSTMKDEEIEQKKKKSARIVESAAEALPEREAPLSESQLSKLADLRQRSRMRKVSDIPEPPKPPEGKEKDSTRKFR